VTGCGAGPAQALAGIIVTSAKPHARFASARTLGPFRLPGLEIQMAAMVLSYQRLRLAT